MDPVLTELPESQPHRLLPRWFLLPEPWAFLLLALGVRSLFLCLSLNTLDRLFIPDDAYYTLTIARSMAHGVGPSVTPGIPTSGFQPLLAFLEIPAFWIFKNSVDAPVWWALGIGVLADSASALLLWSICSRWGGPLAGRMAGFLWALSPIAVANALGGLETSLAILVWLMVIDGYDRALAAGGRRHWMNVLLGICCALAILARVDSALLILALLAHSLWKGLPFRAHLLTLSAALVLIAPWWIYEWTRFGSVVPESGMAVKAQIGFHQSLGLTPAKQAGWALGYLLPFPGLDFSALRMFLWNHRNWTWALLTLATGLTVWTLRRTWGRNASCALYLAGLYIFAFYAFYLPAPWFFKRYLAPAELGVVVGLVLGASSLVRSSRRPGKAVGVAMVSVHLLAGSWQIGSWLAHRRPFDFGYSGAKGYRAPAEAILRALPPGARLGALQSGALAYFAPAWAPQAEVVNLDGVVNQGAYLAIRRSRLRSYMVSMRLDHFADWQFNHKVVDMAAFGDSTRWELRFLLAAPPQGAHGQDRFLLSEIRWSIVKTP